VRGHTRVVTVMRAVSVQGRKVAEVSLISFVPLAFMMLILSIIMYDIRTHAHADIDKCTLIQIDTHAYAHTYINTHTHTHTQTHTNTHI
jgi:hypothetical protein